MSDQFLITVVRAWSQQSDYSNLVITMINNQGHESCDRHFTSIDEAVEQHRQWLIEFDRVVERGAGSPTTRHPDDGDETHD